MAAARARHGNAGKPKRRTAGEDAERIVARARRTIRSGCAAAVDIARGTKRTAAVDIRFLVVLQLVGARGIDDIGGRRSVAVPAVAAVAPQSGVAGAVAHILVTGASSDHEGQHATYVQSAQWERARPDARQGKRCFLRMIGGAPIGNGMRGGWRDHSQIVAQSERRCPTALLTAAFTHVVERRAP